MYMHKYDVLFLIPKISTHLFCSLVLQLFYISYWFIVHLLPYVLPLLGYNSISLHPLQNTKSEHLTTSVCTKICLFPSQLHLCICVSRRYIFIYINIVYMFINTMFINIHPENIKAWTNCSYLHTNSRI